MENQFLIIPKREFEELKSVQQKILDAVNSEKGSVPSEGLEYLTVKEFMERLKIARSKFDQLVADNEIRVIKKGRKLYIPSSEVKRYFEGE